MFLRKEEPLQISKARKFPILIDEKEMKELLSYLQPVEIFDVSHPVFLEEAVIPQEDFLSHYEKYIRGIREGVLIEEGSLRPYFSSIFTMAKEAVYAYPLSNGKYLVKACLPVIQLQRHHFIYSNTLHSGVMGKESVTWGIQFSYPQLYLDPVSKEIGKVEKNAKFFNTALFRKFIKWVREYTCPTPFFIQGERKNLPIRLGKQCFSWINHHPNLQIRGLYVESRESSYKIN